MLRKDISGLHERQAPQHPGNRLDAARKERLQIQRRALQRLRENVYGERRNVAPHRFPAEHEVRTEPRHLQPTPGERCGKRRHDPSPRHFESDEGESVRRRRRNFQLLRSRSHDKRVSCASTRT